MKNWVLLIYVFLLIRCGVAPNPSEEISWSFWNEKEKKERRKKKKEWISDLISVAQMTLSLSWSHLCDLAHQRCDSQWLAPLLLPYSFFIKKQSTFITCVIGLIWIFLQLWTKSSHHFSLLKWSTLLSSVHRTANCHFIFFNCHHTKQSKLALP